MIVREFWIFYWGPTGNLLLSQSRKNSFASRRDIAVNWRFRALDKQ